MMGFICDWLTTTCWIHDCKIDQIWIKDHDHIVWEFSIRSFQDIIHPFNCRVHGFSDMRKWCCIQQSKSHLEMDQKMRGEWKVESCSRRMVSKTLVIGVFTYSSILCCNVLKDVQSKVLVWCVGYSTTDRWRQKPEGIWNLRGNSFWISWSDSKLPLICAKSMVIRLKIGNPPKICPKSH